nr:hypothetical protein [Tanacetum cinerariifolium]
MDKENPWGKDGPGKNIDLHLYRSMIRSLMYLTASRPDIMFAVCACARHQVTPKECHLLAVKRIFRYLKGNLKLRLWYPKDSSFDLVAYSDSDYGGATQDRKSTTRDHNVDFHQIVDFVEASHIRIETTNEGTKILATVDGKPRNISESSIRRNLKLNDEEGISSLPDAELFENLALMGYNIFPNQKFTFQKDDSITGYSMPLPTIESNSDDLQNKNPFVTKSRASFSTILSKPNNINDKGYWDSGCSRHMTGNISYLSVYEPFDRGYVSFGQGGCKITSKGTIKTVNLNNVVPHKDLTCLVAKASADECMLWHMRLVHLNFKTINRLVRHNLVRGLPSKCFDNDHTYAACLKGKQHKASERVKRKGMKLEHRSAKRMKTSEDISKEDLKEMMQLVLVKEVYVEALQVKHPIIDWEIHTEGKRDYWKIIRLGGHTTVYQFFVDMLK